MGICQSCLRRRDHHCYQECDETRLLYDDGQGMQYGSFDDQNLRGDETVEAQHEHEALQEVIAKTSIRMVDVFEIGPQYTSDHFDTPSFDLAGERLGGSRYQRLVSKLGAGGGSPSSDVKVDWVSEGDGGGGDHVSSSPRGSLASASAPDDETSDPLIGTFADAAEAME
ncbi:hypothetical protein E4U47_005857 [Claviceps purpurea]|nr:hypothetical protein E4U38_001851 [Claviceps purpurea]KAG6191470.1 hypothetical protein E4U36_008132 [Claviceps purpurea]KAG6280789.1 hypothetical protein E4U47_005857 [Claviceps purpurea]